MPRGVYLSEDMRKKILQLCDEGIRQIDIAARLKINKSVISKTIANYKNRGSVQSLPKCGRPRKTTRQADLRIKRIALCHPQKSANQILAELPDVNISYKTVQRRLREQGLFSRRAAKKPLISKKNRKARLKFAREHVNWSIKKWKTVLWSDESKFQLFGSDGMAWVHRPVGKRYDFKFTKPTVKHGGGSLMVWGCFSGFGMGPLHLIEGTMDRFVYLDILKSHMLPFAEENMSLLWRFQHDNDPKHKSRLVSDWLEHEKVRVLEWPAQSPDLNPIENLWEELNRQIRRSTIHNKHDLWEILQSTWKSINPTIIDKLLDSMPQRCKDVIRNNGYATRY